jgi:hemin uptake protein HemP
MNHDKSQDPEISVGKDSAIRRIPSQDLLQGSRRVLIQHGTEEYRLQITATGKLILTK